jgi:hypothetical protein
VALAVTKIRDLYDADGSGNGTGGGLIDEAVGSNWQVGPPIRRPPGQGADSRSPANRYYDRLDRLYVRTQTSAAAEAAGYIDPLFLNGVVPNSQAFAGDAAGGMCHFIGEWDRIANTQKLYRAPDPGGGGSNKFLEVNPLTLALLVDDVFQFVGPRARKTAFDGGVDGVNATVGWWNSTGLAPSTTTASGAVLFESMGYILVVGCIRHTDTNLYQNTLLKVKLSDGRATVFGLDDGVGALAGKHVPVRYSSTPNAFQGTQLFGDTVNLFYLQFVPDDDSTPTAPKGFLVFSQDSAIGSTPERIYTKFVEFNPLGIVGVPNRVHKREILLSRFELSESQSPPNATGLYHIFGGEPIFYHPPSRTLRMFYVRSTASVASARTQGAVQGLTIASTPTLSQVLPPTALSTPETLKTVRFATEALGSLGEKVGAANLTWTLERVSTFGESISKTFPGTAQLVNFPVDIATLVVVENGTTTLVEGVDYSMNFGTGLLTWILDHSGATTMVASYEHRQDPATPPHGTLLISTSQSDVNGQAVTEVRYPDNANLVGELDKLTATA